MMLALLLVCLPLPGQAAGEDTVVRKDGRRHVGRIVSETASTVEFEVFIKGSKGQLLGTGRISIPKAEIGKIERASDAGRAADRSEAFRSRGRRRREAMAEMRPAEATFEGLRGLRLEAEHYVLHSTCDASFLKEVAYALDGMHAAYASVFGERRKGGKVDVYLLSSRVEYDAFQKRRHGGVVLNAAFYDPKGRYIAVFDMIQDREARAIRQEIARAEKEITTFKSRVASEERRIAQEARRIRAEIEKQAAQARRAIRSGGGDTSARLAELERRRKALQEKLKADEKAAEEQLRAYRKEANAAIERNDAVIAKNRRILAQQGREMYEVLFHEGFHAYAANFLWEGSEHRRFPRWLHEGMASYYEMSVAEGEDLVHGAPHPEFLEICRRQAHAKALVPLERIVRGGADMFQISHLTEAKRATIYYAQSWALAHYLQGAAGAEKLASYASAVVGGADPVEAFERMMGRPCAEIHEELRRHILELK